MLGSLDQYVICPKKGGGRVCKYMHATAIYNALTQGRTVQNSGSNYPNPPANHTLHVTLRATNDHATERTLFLSTCITYMCVWYAQVIMPFAMAFVVIMTKIKYTIKHSTIVLCPTKVNKMLEN